MAHPHSDGPSPSPLPPSSRSRAGGTRSPAARRRRRRAWLLWGTAPIWLALLVLGSALLVKTTTMSSAVAQYEAGEDLRAAGSFRAAMSFDVIEQWKGPFGLGTTLSRQGDHWGATRQLDEALRTVPEEHRCTVQVNRSLTYESWADEELGRAKLLAAEADALEAALAASPDAPAAGRTPASLRAEARELAAWAEADYRLARQAREDPACAAEDRSEEEQDENDEAKERLQGKAEEADEQADPSPEPVGPDGGASAEEQEAQRLQDLQERNDQAQADAEAERQGRSDGGGSDTKGW